MYSLDQEFNDIDVNLGSTTKHICDNVPVRNETGTLLFSEARSTLVYRRPPRKPVMTSHDKENILRNHLNLCRIVFGRE